MLRSVYHTVASVRSNRSLRQRGLLKAMVYARLLFPCAKLSLKVQAQGTWLAQACGLPADESFDEDDLYEAMDQMNGHWLVSGWASLKETGFWNTDSTETPKF